MDEPVCDLVTVSFQHTTRTIRLNEVIPDANGACTAARSMALSQDAAYQLMRTLQWALEHVGYLPTDEQFEEFRAKLLEDIG